MIAKTDIPQPARIAVGEARAGAGRVAAAGSELRDARAGLPSCWWHPLVGLDALFVLFWATAVGLQLGSGTFLGEFGGHPDEASHYVTGLMVHDYLVGPDWTNPLSFAEDYYQHYPRVSLGHWPPFFYVVQAAWTVPFGPSRVSVMLLMALLTALTAVTVYWSLRAEVGALTAWIVGMLFVALPIVQRYDVILMADTLTGLLCFLAALSFGRFLDSGQWRSAAAFGILASLAIMTKGSGLILALVPPVAVVFSRRYHLAARPAFWLPAGIVVLLCGPWTWLTWHMASNGLASSSPTLEFTIPALEYYSWTLVQVVGFGLFVLAAAGMWVRLVRPALREGARGKWAACGALLLGTWVFDWAVPVNFEERYLMPALPPLLLFLAAGMSWASGRLPASWRAGKTALVGLTVVVVFAVETFCIATNASGGFGGAAQRLLAMPDFDRANLLISSDPLGEGMFIAAVAEREKRPGHTILRGSKVLGQSDWMGHEYTCFCQTPEEMMRLLEELEVGVVVLDTSAPPARDMAHHMLLTQTVAAYPRRWQPLGVHDVLRQAVGHAGALHVYRLASEVGSQRSEVGGRKSETKAH